MTNGGSIEMNTGCATLHVAPITTAERRGTKYGGALCYLGWRSPKIA